MIYDLALSTDAILITGNTKHYPKGTRVITPNEYLNGTSLYPSNR